MKFEEYLAKNHPEMLDEVQIPKFLQRAVMPAVAAAGLLGRPSEVGAAMPQAPAMDAQGEFSDMPFDNRIGPRPDHHISDYDLYYWQIDRVNDFLSKREENARIGKKTSTPMWYLKMGDHYKWKRPKPPKLSEREQAYAKYMNDKKNSEDQKQMMTSLYNSTR
jgi:hypothetical protein